MHKFTGALFIVCLLLSLTGCSNLTSLFFHPQQEYLRTPNDIDLVYESVTTYATDGTEINSWFLPAFVSENNEVDSPIVLFLHGNAENISTHIGSVYWLPEQGVNVFLLDYRGFGHSLGDPYVPAIFQDVESSLIWLRERFPQRKIFILGQSIGSAIATTSMALFKDEYQVSGLILDASFTGYRDIAQEVTGNHLITWPIWPFTWLLPTEWDPKAHIADISPSPILMFHSETDPVLPYSLGLELYNSAQEPKHWQPSKGGHIQTFNFEEYRQTLLDFLTR
ncbi:MAG: alpha/beta fold hydrolase [Oleispira antarctica]|nr:alpha/beta fold hydrolase [Oleispira antarctica]MBQ0793807.1 alpha/beta fold hydrolase [Oleispira antarctica]